MKKLFILIATLMITSVLTSCTFFNYDEIALDNGYRDYYFPIGNEEKSMIELYDAYYEGKRIGVFDEKTVYIIDLNYDKFTEIQLGKYSTPNVDENDLNNMLTNHRFIKRTPLEYIDISKKELYEKEKYLTKYLSYYKTKHPKAGYLPNGIYDEDLFYKMYNEDEEIKEYMKKYVPKYYIFLFIYNNEIQCYTK